MMLIIPDHNDLRTAFRHAWREYVDAGRRMRELLLSEAPAPERLAQQTVLTAAKDRYEMARQRYVDAMLEDLQTSVGRTSCGLIPAIVKESQDDSTAAL